MRTRPMPVITRALLSSREPSRRLLTKKRGTGADASGIHPTSRLPPEWRCRQVPAVVIDSMPQPLPLPQPLLPSLPIPLAGVAAGVPPDRSPGSPRQTLQAQMLAILPHRPELVLVTDLDGTLLGGPLVWRRMFYRWLTGGIRSGRVLHLFCTGRDLRSVARLLEEEAATGLCPPHLVIGDVGCTVACGHSLEPLPLVVDPIEHRWRGVPERVLPILAGMPGISPQPVTADRRLAYYIDVANLDRQQLVQLERHGVDCLVSDNRYLDILPAGINKGSTLMSLLECLQVEPASVVTAGDSLNDLAMFETGLNSVVVGNAEPALLESLPPLESIYAAAGFGCAGIIEGLRHFGFAHLLEALPPGSAAAGPS